MFKKDYIQNCAKNGWANFRSGTVPKTNNNMEGYNRAIKQTVTNYQSKSFSDFFQLMKDELISKSEEASKIMRFPKIPYYNEVRISYVLLIYFQRTLIGYLLSLMVLILLQIQALPALSIKREKGLFPLF